MQYLQNPNLLPDHNEYFADDIDDDPLSSNTKEGFLKTATTLINRLFQEDDCSEVKSREENNQIELAKDNQKDDRLFECLQYTLNISRISQSPIPTLCLQIEADSNIR